ncbi:hypothetical protein [Streptomyces canus]|uniref:hypothetical protein n=1 Tax=Streptomyces canus TaxID=58343 RepID=UPI0030E35ECE
MLLGIGGTSKILPATFVVIVATVTLFGLTAGPVARRLGVVRPSRSRPLLVSGDSWVVGLGAALKSAGPEVLMWAGEEDHRACIRQSGTELAPGERLGAATGWAAELEGITAVYFLTAEDDCRRPIRHVRSSRRGSQKRSSPDLPVRRPSRRGPPSR